ncbi:unnamed protein product [Sphagnum compactum]
MNVHPGLNYAINAAGPQLQKLGISDAELATKISSQLALTLHVPAAQPVLAATACSTAQQTSVTNALATPAGQLFCAINTNGGGQIVAGIVDASAQAANPAAGAAAVIVTGATQSMVQADCAAAAKAAGGTAGVPVSTPAPGTVAAQTTVAIPAAVTPLTVGAQFHDCANTDPGCH